MPSFDGEPSLDELLAEPIIQAVMESDHVAPRDVRRLLRDARDRRGHRRKLEEPASNPC
jgi:hypothetical protein